MAEPKTADAQYTIGTESHLAIDQEGPMIHADAKVESILEAVEQDYEGKPTDEELGTLRRVSGNIPMTAYVLCFVEFCERGSYYSATGVISNFVNRVCLESSKTTSYADSSIETSRWWKWLRGTSTRNPADCWCFGTWHSESQRREPVFQDGKFCSIRHRSCSNLTPSLSTVCPSSLDTSQIHILVVTNSFVGVLQFVVLLMF
jgi:hypothetical protein